MLLHLNELKTTLWLWAQLAWRRHSMQRSLPTDAERSESSSNGPFDVDSPGM